MGFGQRGRPCSPIVLAYVLANAAAVVRTAVGYVGPDGVQISGGLWTVAFGIFFVLYLPILWGPRADGRPG